jgi:carboxypeptidase C (cathepsin A)
MRTLIITLAASLAVAAPLFTCAQEKSEESKESKPAEKKEDGKPEEKRKDEKKEKEEKPKESRGSVTIGGKEIKYLAKTGTMPLLKEDGSGERASVFFVYYAVTNGDGKPLPRTRRTNAPSLTVSMADRAQPPSGCSSAASGRRRLSWHPMD